MADKKKRLDIQEVLEQSTTRASLRDLAEKGFENVKVLDENAIQDLIQQAVDRVVTSLSEDERGRILADSRRELDRMMREHKAMRSDAELLAASKNDLMDQVTSLQRQLKEKLAALETARSEKEEAELELKTLRGDAEHLKEEFEKVQEELDRAREKIEQREEKAKSLQSQVDKAAKDLEHAQAKVAELKEALAEAQKHARAAKESEAAFLAQVREFQARSHASLKEQETLRREWEAARHEVTTLTEQLAHARAIEHMVATLKSQAKEQQERNEAGQKETKGLRVDLVRLQAELTTLRGAISESNRRESALRLQLEEAQSRAEVEQREVKVLREEADRFQKERVRLQKEIDEAHAESKTQRERILLMVTQLQESRIDSKEVLQVRSDVQGLRELIEQGKPSGLEPLLATARAGVRESKQVTATLKALLSRIERPRTGVKVTRTSGPGYDGLGLLQNFFRKLALRELFQEYIPLKRKPQEEHPSQTLLSLVTAAATGTGRGPRGGRLEVRGTWTPDVAAQRRLLQRLSPATLNRLARIHTGLRLQLNALPRAGTLVLDVDEAQVRISKKTYRALVGYDSRGPEFWAGRLLPAKRATLKACIPFLQECLAQVPANFPRKRLRLRLDERFFDQAVVQFLQSSGCGFVIAAAGSPGLWSAVQDGSFRKLTGGRAVAEFVKRVSPTGKSQLRFVAVRLSRFRSARSGIAPTFKDRKFGYFVFMVDAKTRPWEAFELYTLRASAQARLRCFAESRLPNGRPAAHAAFFQTALLASDLVLWFTRRCLDKAYQGADVDRLRSELLVVPESMGRRTVVMLPKADHRRRVFERAARRLRRLRLTQAFRLSSVRGQV